MSIFHEPLIIPHEATVYAADGVRMGVVNSIGMQSLRIRQGRLMTTYLDIPVRFVDHIQHGHVYLSTSNNVTLAASRAVPTADTPDIPMPVDPVAVAAAADPFDPSNAAESAPNVEIPYDAPVYARDGALLGITVDATRTTIIVKVGKLRAYRLSLPLSIIDRVENEQVWLTVMAEDAKQIGEGRKAAPPLTRTPRVVSTEPKTHVAAR